jgi:hypothetical protein
LAEENPVSEDAAVPPVPEAVPGMGAAASLPMAEPGEVCRAEVWPVNAWPEVRLLSRLVSTTPL